MPRGRFETVPGQPRLRNVVGTIPGDEARRSSSARTTTRCVEPKGFVGANDGAAGHGDRRPARARDGAGRAHPEAPEIRFVLFDGEEQPTGLPEEQDDFYDDAACAARAPTSRRHGKETSRMILLDYVGNKGLRLPRERTSNGAIWADIRRAAGTRGRRARYFPPGTGAAVVDDHTPFLRAGIPAVDLIDLTYARPLDRTRSTSSPCAAWTPWGRRSTEYLRRFVH